MAKRQANQVIVAGLVSAIVATVVTSAGLSTAQDTQPPPPEGGTSQPPPMDGGGSYQPPGGSNYSPMPPPEGGYPMYPQQGSYPHMEGSPMPQPGQYGMPGNMGPGMNFGPGMGPGPYGPGMHGAPGGMNFGPESGPSQRILDEAKKNNGRVFQDESGSWRWDGSGPQQGNQGRGFGQGFQGSPNGGMGSFGNREGGFGQGGEGGSRSFGQGMPGGMGDMMRGGPGMGPGGPGGMRMPGGMGPGGNMKEGVMRGIDSLFQQFDGETCFNAAEQAKIKKAITLIGKLIKKAMRLADKFESKASTAKNESTQEKFLAKAEGYRLQAEDADEKLTELEAMLDESTCDEDIEDVE